MNTLPPVILDARTATCHFPGIGRYVERLGRTLLELTGSVRFLRPDPAGSPATGSWPGPVCTASPFSWRQQLEVPRLVKGLQGRLLHVPFYMIPLRPGVPLVWTCHDLLPLRFPEYYAWPRRIVYLLGHRLAARKAASVIAISETTRRDLIRFTGLAPGRVRIIPLAACDFLGPGPDRLPPEPGRPARYALYTGSNKPHKNLPMLVEAWLALWRQPDLPRVPLVIAGHWDHRYPEARRLAATGDPSAILFLGRVSEEKLAALYRQADLFVFPSRGEGFGLPVLEAMAAGVPVACSRAGSLPEVGGEAVAYFDPDDAPALIRLLAGLLADEDRRRELAAAGYRRAGLFSWRRTAEATLNEYQRILTG